MFDLTMEDIMTPQEEFEQEWTKLHKPWQDDRGEWHKSPFNYSEIEMDSFRNDGCWDDNLGTHFDAHGIAKGNLEAQKKSLLELCKNGISEQTFSAPFCFTEESSGAGAGLGVADGAYKNGLAVVISDYKKSLKDGIKLVLLTDLGESLLPSLRKMYPNIMFEKLSQAQKAFETLYTESTGKQWKTKINAPSTQDSTQSQKLKVPSAPAPRISTPQKQQSPVDKLVPQHFIDKDGIKGVRYLDENGNVAITEMYYKNCSERLYANGLKMYLWKDSQSITFVDGTKKDRESTEMFVHTKGQGWTKMTQTTGELKRKIEEVRKAGLLVTNLPNTPKRSSTIKGRLMRHSMDNAPKITGRIGGNQGA